MRLRVLPLLAVFAFCAIAANAPARDYNLTIGKQETIDSKILGEKRDILVAQSPHFRAGAPVLVLLDAEYTFQSVKAIVDHLVNTNRLPPVLIAGITNVDRGRDLTPTFQGNDFATGPADRFLSFISDELIPRMAAEYPIGGYHILAGHSNGGMFALYAFIRRPDLFQANLALSPSWGLDDRFVSALDRALAQPTAAPRFVFLSAGGDEESDIAEGSLRYAMTFEGSPDANVEFHYQVFPGETHGSVAMRAFYSGLEAVGEADAPVAYGPARYLSEPQRRRHAWIRRFGQPFADDPLPLFSIARPILDALAAKEDNSLSALWERLQTEYSGDFRFDAAERQNLIEYLAATGRKDDASRLQALPGFAVSGLAPNNYGAEVHLDAGLMAHLLANGSAIDSCHPGKTATVHGAVPAPDRGGKPNAAYRFHGQGDFIQFPNNGDYSTSGSISVSAWVRPHHPAAYSSWVAQATMRGPSQWRLGFGPSPDAQWGATTYGTRWTDYWVPEEGFRTDTWNHTAAVFDQTLGILRIYLYGREIKTIYNLVPWNASSGPLLIGAQRDDGIYFDGDVSDVRVYRRALNPAEVEALSKLDSSSASSCKTDGPERK
jgi:predicted alpha/beta superfamily hydrolase